MKIEIKKHHKFTVFYAALGLIILFAGSVFLAYATSMRDPLAVFFKRLYPAAFIGGRIISINDLEYSGLIGSRLNVNPQTAKQQYLDSEKAATLAKNLKLKISSDARADEFRFYTKGKEQEYQTLLNKFYDGSEHFFYKYAINPQVIDANLRIKYYNDIKNSSAEYNMAKQALKKIKKGEKFEEIAKAESDDAASGQLGGDLGFYESGQLLPELEDQASVSAMGEVRQEVITTRLGYHLIYPVENSTVEGKRMWHLKHILYAPEGYELWREKQLQTIEVKYIKK